MRPNTAIWAGKSHKATILCGYDARSTPVIFVNRRSPPATLSTGYWSNPAKQMVFQIPELEIFQKTKKSIKLSTKKFLPVPSVYSPVDEYPPAAKSSDYCPTTEFAGVEWIVPPEALRADSRWDRAKPAIPTNGRRLEACGGSSPLIATILVNSIRIAMGEDRWSGFRKNLNIRRLNNIEYEFLIFAICIRWNKKAFCIKYFQAYIMSEDGNIRKIPSHENCIELHKMMKFDDKIFEGLNLTANCPMRAEDITKNSFS